MPDLFQAPDRGAVQDPALEPQRAGPTPESAAPSGAEQSPYHTVFADTFAQAYDTREAPGRGAEVMADVSAEARTFGDEWTVQSLAAERFGPAARPALNDWLAASLRTEAGEEAVLHALKDGAPTPGTGDDLVVLLDKGFVGHTAVLIGNDRAGWDLYSKDGTSNLTAVYGRPNYTGEDPDGTPRERLARHFDTLDDFFGRGRVADRYEAAVRVELDRTPAAGVAARAAAERILVEPYNIATSSCAHVVRGALDAAGVDGFSMTETHTSGSGFNTQQTTGFVVPKRQFGDLRATEEGDDRPSAAQRAWERRSADNP